MLRFLEDSPEAARELEQRARAACVRFRECRLPAGAQPDRADVGFETDAATGRCAIFVTRGVRYSGADPSIRQWFERGEKTFSSFAALWQWLTQTVAPRARTARSEPAAVGQLIDAASLARQLPPRSIAPAIDREALFRELSAQVRGQDATLRALAGCVTRHAARVDPQRPASLFAVGPTGVGKTRTASLLAPALKRLDPGRAGYGYLRLDMVEYQERHRVSQLLGAPAGYVGYGDGASLTDALLANPRSVVLFDEIEKAHPDILRTLMNMMDCGRLSLPARADGQNEIDCRQAILIFTSNLCSREILREFDGPGRADDSGRVNEVCRRHLRASGMAPELVGRIGQFLFFRPLDDAGRAEAMVLAIDRAAREYGVQLVRIEPSVVAALLDASSDTTLGVRPDEYKIDELLGDTFAAAARRLPGGRFVLSGGAPFVCAPASESRDSRPTSEVETPAAPVSLHGRKPPQTAPEDLEGNER